MGCQVFTLLFMTTHCFFYNSAEVVEEEEEEAAASSSNTSSNSESGNESIISSGSSGSRKSTDLGFQDLRVEEGILLISFIHSFFYGKVSHYLSRTYFI